MKKRIYTALACLILFATQATGQEHVVTYFKSGVQRTQIHEQTVVMESSLEDALHSLDISIDDVTCAFPDFDEADTVMQTDDGPVARMNRSRLFRIVVPSGTTAEALTENLMQLDEVGFCHPEVTYEQLADPNDPYFTYQWGLKSSTTHKGISATEAWDVFTGSNAVIVGIIDDGVRSDHPDLAGRLFYSSDTADQGYSSEHGTRVTGIIGAVTNNGSQIAGVDWNAKLHPERTDNTWQSKVEAIDDARLFGCRILNMSWGGGYNPAIDEAIAAAYKTRVTSIGASGNDGNPYVLYPASSRYGVMSVGAQTQQGLWAQNSNYGIALDFIAPGENIYSLNPDGPPSSLPTRTSFAAPFVTGIASLLRGYNTGLRPDDIYNIIRLSCDKPDPTIYDYDDKGWNERVGYGRPNAKKALDYLRAPYVLTHRDVNGGTRSAYSDGELIIHMGVRVGPLLEGHAYIMDRYPVTINVTFQEMADPNVWGTGGARDVYGPVRGWPRLSTGDFNFDVAYCEVVPGSVTHCSATLRTWIYHAFEYDPEFGRLDSIGWFPTRSNPWFDYTTLGRPATALNVQLSGPSVVSSKCDLATVIAEVTGGVGGYAYQWNGGGTSSELTKQVCTCPTSFILTVTSGCQTVVTTKDVMYLACDPCNEYPYCKRQAGELGIPEEFELSQNYPNPFNPTTTIPFGLPEPSYAELAIYNTNGQLVRKIFSQYMEPGYYTSSWHGTDDKGRKVASGIYLCRLMANKQVHTRKVLLIK